MTTQHLFILQMLAALLAGGLLGAAWANRVWSQRQAARDAEALDEHFRLLHLLARIHRDGGHYVAAVGVAQACQDADRIVAQLHADADSFQQRYRQKCDEETKALHAEIDELHRRMKAQQP